ncbi:Diaminopimelate decarboxylase [Candidatus Lokiarchaeum ossiferum]|uniref:Diaminopimelate decarboxylase n=1 Tax=Candidatus Lokiarchaeum ossiferum TaxID=2951803 RepID=A0ABY6HPS5_9ARCH|nr:Diaminopimelate decarboxylase [Candidatus Lokiarchaeum sp. B-35]
MVNDNWLKLKDLEYRNQQLYCGDQSLTELAQTYGTPLYVVNEDLIRKRYRTIHNIFSNRYSKVRIHYAVKSNSNLSVLRILEEEGAYVDAVSSGEVFLTKKSGFTSDRIMQTGNNWTDEEMQYALDNNIMINLDAISHIHRLKKLCGNSNQQLPILSFRINPEFGDGHHDHCITAGKTIKFGIFEPQVIEAFKIAKECGFTQFGAHMHIGSGILNITSFKKALDKYFQIIRSVVEELDITFEFLDFGGGIGIPYRDSENPLSIEKYADLLISKLQYECETMNLGTPYLAIEPGRYISSEASILLSQVNTIKNNGFRHFIGIDAGFNTLIRPVLYGSYHEIVSLLKTESDESIIADVVGQLCESGDVLGKDRKFSHLEERDYLAILDAGAYGFSMSSTYNSRPRSAEVLISRGHANILIRERESFDDLLLHQIIPDRLKIAGGVENHD